MLELLVKATPSLTAAEQWLEFCFLYMAMFFVSMQVNLNLFLPFFLVGGIELHIRVRMKQEGDQDF